MEAIENSYVGMGDEGAIPDEMRMNIHNHNSYYLIFP